MAMRIAIIIANAWPLIIAIIAISSAINGHYYSLYFLPFMAIIIAMLAIIIAISMAIVAIIIGMYGH